MQSDSAAYEDPEPSWLDLEDQIVRNAAYGYELEQAGELLHSQSTHWYIATSLCLSVALGLMVFIFSLFRTDHSIIRDYVALTILTTTATLLLAASAACFVHFMTLRRLAGEALRISGVNRNMVIDAREFVEKLH